MAQPEANPNRPRVILLDDETLLAALLHQTLEGLGYPVTAYSPLADSPRSLDATATPDDLAALMRAAATRARTDYVTDHEQVVIALPLTADAIALKEAPTHLLFSDLHAAAAPFPILAPFINERPANVLPPSTAVPGETPASAAPVATAATTTAANRRRARGGFTA